MSKLKLLSISAIVLLLLNVATVSFLLFSKPPSIAHGRPPMAHEGPKQVIIEKLHFDLQQTADYEKLITEHREVITTLEDSVSMLKSELYQSLKQERQVANDSIVNRLANIQKQIEIVNFNHFLEIKRICRPDQLKKFNELTAALAGFFVIKRDAPPPMKH